ncbi:ABC transporter permease [Leuconostoc lactis]|uniref:ABC transporter permease n=1 Tax=Leuconostoc lactis TaxID=1246 RepID=UPI000E95F5A4|nr:ABC transporter permease [Leuconostoc lactis]WKY78883.1 ABC transporter permease [Leuconostoc lactis]HBP97588.1 ABC transporter permease [Leuconostoc lactis]
MPNGLMIVIKQTYRNHFKSRGYWLLVLSPIIFAGIIAAVVFGITKMQGNTTPNVAVVGNPAVRQVMIKSEKNLDLKVSRITTQAEANKSLDKQTLDGVLTFNANGATLTTQPKSNKINQEAISSVLGNLARTQKAAQYGLTPEQTQALIQPYQLKSVVKQADNRTTNGDNSSMANYGIAVAIGVITMVVVMWYTSMIATEIANEKSSRIMETLLAATSSNIQYFGKIIGIFALTLTHMLLYLVAGIIAYIIFKNNAAVAEIAHNFSGITVGFTVYAVCFILVAVALYLVLTAIIASLVNDNSQVQQAVGPVTVLAMIGYFFSYFMTNMPNNIVIKILSYVPFISQSMMPVRLVTKVESWPAAIVALALSAIALVLLAWFGRGIYAKNVLSYSDDKIMAQLIRNIKHRD